MKAEEAAKLVEQSKKEYDEAQAIESKDMLYGMIKSAALERKETISGSWYNHGFLPFQEDLIADGYHVYTYYSGGGYTWRISWGGEAEKRFKEDAEREKVKAQSINSTVQPKKSWWR